MNIITYICTLIVLAIFDSAWLLSMGAKYKLWLGHLFAPTVNFIPAIIFYLIYTAGVVFFVVLPAIKGEHSLLWTLGVGCLFGLVAYATYDLTNNATLKDWPVFVTLIDMIWGTILTGLTAVIVVFLSRYFK